MLLPEADRQVRNSRVPCSLFSLYHAVPAGRAIAGGGPAGVLAWHASGHARVHLVRRRPAGRCNAGSVQCTAWYQRATVVSCCGRSMLALPAWLHCQCAPHLHFPDPAHLQREAAREAAAREAAEAERAAREAAERAR